jgi:predicted ATP-grasp superfamily ATP-dependent carboligase
MTKKRPCKKESLAKFRTQFFFTKDIPKSPKIVLRQAPVLSVLAA